MFYTSFKDEVVKLLGPLVTLDKSEQTSPEAKTSVPDTAIINKNSMSPSLDLKSAIDNSTAAVTSFMLKNGVPGALVCVSKDKQTVWRTSFGFCDVENMTRCDADALMRIASISKSIFAASIVAPMVESGELSLNSSIHEYLSNKEFPKQKYANKDVNTTVEQLLSHTSGIRSYLGNNDLSEFKAMPIGSANSTKIYQCFDQYFREEFFQRRTYRDVIDSLEVFKNDPLEKEPGEFNYTTYGYSVLSAVAQKIHQKHKENEKIEEFWIKLLKNKWGMKNTHLDHDEIILSKRSRNYLRTGINGQLINAPYVDNSIKWAGGGLLSTTADLVKFGNHLLDSYHSEPSAILKKETIDLFWKEVKDGYALGFKTKIINQGTPNEELVVSHSGAACGAASMLLIMPRKKIVVAVIVNLGFTNPTELAYSIAEEFRKVSENDTYH